MQEFWRLYKYEGDIKAREKLIIECLPMVKSFAQRFSVYDVPCCDVDDLVNAGIIGLLDAVEKYDPIMQNSFKTYARFRIRGAILDEIRKLNWAPRSIQEKVRNLRRTYASLENKLSRPPTEEELSSAMAMNLEEFRKMLVQIGPSTVLMLSLEYSGERDNPYEAFIEDPNSVNPADQVLSNEIKSILADAIRSLPKKESIVISLYYYEEMTMKEIGEVLSLTESRVCQIHTRAILNLFHALNSKMINDGAIVI